MDVSSGETCLSFNNSLDAWWPNSLWQRQNGRDSTDDIFNGMVLSENRRTMFKTSLKCVPSVPINNTSALVQKTTLREQVISHCIVWTYDSLVTLTLRDRFIQTKSHGLNLLNVGHSWPETNDNALPWTKSDVVKGHDVVDLQATLFAPSGRDDHVASIWHCDPVYRKTMFIFSIVVHRGRISEVNRH